MTLTNTGRIHGLDVLRGVAMILGIFLHGAIAYKEGYHYGDWVFDPANTSWFYDWLYLVINSFRMQLFFLLAGFFARLLIVRNGVSDFIMNRLKRVGLPLLFSYFTILPLTLIPYLYTIHSREVADPWPILADFFPRFFTLRERYGFMHLWFLQHLLLFYVVATGAVMFGKYTGADKIVANINSKLAGIKLKAAGFIFIAVLPLTLISILFSTPLPSIWTGFVIPIPQFLYYALFFFLGWILETHRGWFSSFQKGYKLNLAIGTVLSIAVLYYLNTTVFDLTTKVFLPATDMRVILMKLVASFQTLTLVVGSIGWFSITFSNPSAFWKYVADSAYWIYLIHLPLVMTTQLLLLNTGVPGILRFPIVVLVTLFFSFLTYRYLVRYTWIGTMLNGKRSKDAVAA
ncbi:MAG TPA: acyltransferase family protein [Cyclobacteriaceae bacterium]|nr:acyltransferase family protein [Cyclobacteriaceae bacterium]